MARTAANKYLPAGLPAIQIPTQMAINRYGKEVAEIMDQLAASGAKEAKGRPVNDFRWSIIYQKADDPETFDKDEFLHQLCHRSTVYLMGYGYKWKGWVELKATPPQVMGVFEQRADLVCRSRQKAEQVDIDDTDLVEPESLTTDQDLLEVFNRWVRERNLTNSPFTRMARMAMDQMLAANEQNGRA